MRSQKYFVLMTGPLSRSLQEGSLPSIPLGNANWSLNRFAEELIMALPATARQDLSQLAKVGFDFMMFSIQWVSSNSGIRGLPDCKHVHWSEGSTELTPYLNSGVFRILSINCRFHVNASAQEHIRLDLQKRVWVDPRELGCAEHSRWILFGERNEII